MKFLMRMLPIWGLLMGLCCLSGCSDDKEDGAAEQTNPLLYNSFQILSFNDQPWRVTAPLETSTQYLSTCRKNLMTMEYEIMLFRYDTEVGAPTGEMFSFSVAARSVNLNKGDNLTPYLNEATLYEVDVQGKRLLAVAGYAHTAGTLEVVAADQSFVRLRIGDLHYALQASFAEQPAQRVTLTGEVVLPISIHAGGSDDVNPTPTPNPNPTPEV